MSALAPRLARLLAPLLALMLALMLALQLVRRLASAKYFAVVPGIRLTFQRLTLRLL